MTSTSRAARAPEDARIVVHQIEGVLLQAVLHRLRRQRGPGFAADLGFGRIVASEKQAPNTLANLARRG